MNNNQLIVIVIAILAAACIIGGAVAFTFNKPVEEVNVTIDNNTTNFTENLTEDVESSSNGQSPTTYCHECGKALYGTNQCKSCNDKAKAENIAKREAQSGNNIT